MNNLKNESGSTYEPILQQWLDGMAYVVSWWLQSSQEERVAVTRIVIEQERLKGKLADAPVARADANAA
jgi:ABC-type phosphate/phosphonate transport system ATPase subunit